MNLRAVSVCDDGVGRDRLGPASGEGGQVGLDRHTVEADRLLDRRPGDRQHAVLVGETEKEDVGRSRRAEQLLGNARRVDVAVALGQRRRRDLGPQFVEFRIRNLGLADHRPGGRLARRADQHRAGRVARRERGGAGGTQQVEGDDDIGTLVADQVRRRRRVGRDPEVAAHTSGFLREAGLVEPAHVQAVEHRSRGDDLGDGDDTGATDPDHSQVE